MEAAAATDHQQENSHPNRLPPWPADVLTQLAKPLESSFAALASPLDLEALPPVLRDANELHVRLQGFWMPWHPKPQQTEVALALLRWATSAMHCPGL